MQIKKKYAIFSMDIEDWYHLDYFLHTACDRSYTMIDGLDTYQQLMAAHQICSSFFVTGEIISPLRDTLRRLSEAGNDIGIHGWNHVRPLSIDLNKFEENVRSCKTALENTLGKQVAGYRAPCFSLDRNRLDIIKSVGINYDSSRILFREHSLYGELDMDDFKEVFPGVYRQDDFFEFEVSTLPFAGKRIPISGGGYLRIFPWFITERLIRRYIHGKSLYVLYVHPFELSVMPNPAIPRGVSLATRCRFSIGRKSVHAKLNSLIEMLKFHGFEFTTFSALREELLREK